ncbi:MAG: peptide-methionine (R)-S-oxide reductase MsrB [Candidatus Thorarchaeota archaeon]|nr:peptide-methionine (R)-S-oxide reductase MsrB [Candidatus Thorarchaeota archaeon]
MDTIERSEEEWKLVLTADQYRVLRQKATERPFTGEYVHHKGNGVYVCAGCGNELFRSETKFYSGSGWPSFWDKISEDSIITRVDNSHGMKRIEVLCRRCGGHLGHLFDDGPGPTGLRYCINSVALQFRDQTRDRGQPEGQDV